MGYPSNTVADAEGVPGVLRRIAETLPPYMDPQNIAARTTIEGMTSNWYMSGSRRMIPMEPLIPGMAPITIPPTDPMSIMSSVMGSKDEINPCSIWLKTVLLHVKRNKIQVDKS